MLEGERNRNGVLKCRTRTKREMERKLLRIERGRKRVEEEEGGGGSFNKGMDREEELMGQEGPGVRWGGGGGLYEQRGYRSDTVDRLGFSRPGMLGHTECIKKNVGGCGEFQKGHTPVTLG